MMGDDTVFITLTDAGLKQTVQIDLQLVLFNLTESHVRVHVCVCECASHS